MARTVIPMNRPDREEAERMQRFQFVARSVSWAVVRRYPGMDYDEVYSDALLGLFKALRAGSRALRSYVEVECSHGVRARVRARNRNGYATDMLPEPPDRGDDADARDWLAHLPVKERRAATLAACGFSQDETAQILGVSQMTVSRWLRHAQADWREEAT